MKNRITSFFPFLTLSSLLLTFLTFLTFLSANAQVPSYVPTNGLVGYWPFNGNANDESGNGNNGTVNGASLAVDRNNNVNSSYSFDGVDDWISFNLQNVDTSYSLTFWLYSTSINVEMNFLELFMSSYCQPTPENNIYYNQGSTTGNTSVSSNYTYVTGTWCNVLFSYDGVNNLQSIYINGELDSVKTVTGTMSSLNSLLLAKRPNNTGYYFGKLDDIGIWNRALTADEVLALYNGCNVTALAVSGNVTPTQFTQETYTYPNTTGSTYNWTVTNGVIVSGQGTNSIDVMWANTGIGSVSVVETNASNCTGDVVTYDVVVIPTNIEELSNTLILYPNPATTELNLQTTSDLIGTDLFVFDALGKQILKQQILSTNTIINTSSFAVGNYVVKVGGGVKKFEVVR